jgi:hypothetical protein
MTLVFKFGEELDRPDRVKVVFLFHFPMVTPINQLGFVTRKVA